MKKMNTVDLKTFIEKIITEIKGNKASFLLGSGISLSSGIPMVGSIREDNSIVYGIETYILSSLGFSVSDIAKFISTIPFETFFEVLIDNNLDMELFDEVFMSEPTFFHKTIAKLVQVGITSSIATTNFDECIEKALDMINIDYDIYLSNRKITRKKKGRTIVRKFHGSIDDINNLVISIKRIANRVGYERRKMDVEDFINDSNCIIVCGYSCSDIFDLTPMFQSFKEKKGKRIIYINHINDDGFEIISKNRNSEFIKVSNMFGEYNLTIVRCNTNVFIDEFARNLNIMPEIKDELETNWKQIIDNCLNKFSVYQKNKVCGNLSFKISDNLKSIDYWEKAYGATDNESEKIACLRSIAWTLICEKKYNDALDILLPLSNNDQEMINKHYGHYANIYNFIGVCYTVLNPDAAESYYFESLKICRKNKLQRELGFVLINLAELYEGLHDINKSIEMTKQALEVMDKEGYVDTVGICHSNLAFYYYSIGEYQKAKDSITEAINIASKLGENSINNRLIIRNAIEIQQFIQLKTDHLRELQKTINNGNNTSDKANCNYLVGELYHMSGQLMKAIECWTKAKEQYNEIHTNSLFGEVNALRLEEHAKCV